MNLNSNIDTDIDRYLNKEMTQEELAAFEARLKNDFALRKEVELQKAVINSFKGVARGELKSFFGSIPLKEQYIGKWARMSIAATILLLVSIGFIFRDQLFNNVENIITLTDTSKVKEDTIKRVETDIKNQISVIVNDTVKNQIYKKENVIKTFKIPVIEVEKKGFAFASDTSIIDSIQVNIVQSTKYKNHYSFYNDTLKIYKTIDELKDIKILFDRHKNMIYLLILDKNYLLQSSKAIQPL